ncbi:MAG TPA: hypothetical protein PLX16_00720 [Exilispira sp.]|nr:hypothetical protein [Exilispira sp.]
MLISNSILTLTFYTPTFKNFKLKGSTIYFLFLCYKNRLINISDVKNEKFDLQDEP